MIGMLGPGRLGYGRTLNCDSKALIFVVGLRLSIKFLALAGRYRSNYLKRTQCNC